MYSHISPARPSTSQLFILLLNPRFPFINIPWRHTLALNFPPLITFPLRLSLLLLFLLFSIAVFFVGSFVWGFDVVWLEDVVAYWEEEGLLVRCYWWEYLGGAEQSIEEMEQRGGEGKACVLAWHSMEHVAVWWIDITSWFLEAWSHWSCRKMER